MNDTHEFFWIENIKLNYVCLTPRTNTSIICVSLMQLVWYFSWKEYLLQPDFDELQFTQLFFLSDWSTRIWYVIGLLMKLKYSNSILWLNEMMYKMILIKCIRSFWCFIFVLTYLNIFADISYHLQWVTYQKKHR